MRLDEATIARVDAAVQHPEQPTGTRSDVLREALRVYLLLLDGTLRLENDSRHLEQQALRNAIDMVAAIAGIVKLAQHEPRKDAWRSIGAIADILDRVT